MNKAYYFNRGWDAARDAEDHPPVGRFLEQEELLWWAGWYSYKGGLPRMIDERE